MSFYLEWAHQVPITMDENSLTTTQGIMKLRKMGTKKRHNYRGEKNVTSAKSQEKERHRTFP